MLPAFASDFQNEPITDIVSVGAVGSDRARLWIRSQHPGELVVRWWPEGSDADAGEAHFHCETGARHDGTCAIDLPGRGGRPLAPLTRHRFLVKHLAEGRVLGDGAFQTAPSSEEDAPERFAVALLSCHQPFAGDGTVHPYAGRMLRDVHAICEKHDVKLLLEAGDQAYSDRPTALSLFDPAHFRQVGPPGRTSILDCTADEVRRLYHRRYRHFWSAPGWRELHAHFPSYPILDDHELVDNWGSDPEHATPRWAALREGARGAYFDYQGLRVLPRRATLPADFGYELVYGPLAVHAMDLRSHRSAAEEGRLVSQVQIERLKRFLERHAARPVLALVLSVPLVHLPPTLSRAVAHLHPTGGDLSDRWAARPHARDRDRILELLHDHQAAHPAQRLLLLSGDIHIGCAHRLRWRDAPRAELHQLISSGVTHRPSLLIRLAAAVSMQATRALATLDGRLTADVHPLRGTPGSRNPLASLNVGILQLERATPAPGWTVTLLLYGPGATCRFRHVLPAPTPAAPAPARADRLHSAPPRP